MGEAGKDLLGWKVFKQKPNAKKFLVDLPTLSPDEQQLVLELGEMFKESSKKYEYSDRAEAEEKIRDLLRKHCELNSIMMELDQFEYLTKIAVMHNYGYAIIEPLLAQDFEEIAVIGLNMPVYVFDRKKGWLETNCYFTKQETVVNVINKMARPMGRRITLQTPRLNTVLPDGSRLHASIPPISSVELTIRKFSAKPITIPDLIETRTFSSEALAFLWLAMQADASILISGNTASGKTSTLNALFSFVPLQERVLITEETPEINIPHEHKVKMIASQELGISMSELVQDSLRMRPDRVIIGEVRTKEEAGALMETIISGQARGSYATIHAQSGAETLRRIRSLGCLPIDLNSIDLIVVQRRMQRYDAKTRKLKEIRRCTEISEVVPQEQNGAEENSLPIVRKIYSYDHKSDSLARILGESLAERKISNSTGMGMDELKGEISKRKKFLEEMAAGKNEAENSFESTVAKMQKFAYANE